MECFEALSAEWSRLRLLWKPEGFSEWRMSKGSFWRSDMSILGFTEDDEVGVDWSKVLSFFQSEFFEIGSERGIPGWSGLLEFSFDAFAGITGSLYGSCS